MTSSYPQQRARLRELLGRSPQTGASSLAPSAPLVVLGLTTGGASTCAGCEDPECGFCVIHIPVACNACGQDGATELWERKGEIVLAFHWEHLPAKTWEVTAELARSMAADCHALAFDGRWTA